MSPSVTATGGRCNRARARISPPPRRGLQLHWIAEPGTFVEQGDVIARMQVDELRLQRPGAGRAAESQQRRTASGGS